MRLHTRVGGTPETAARAGRSVGADTRTAAAHGGRGTRANAAVPLILATGTSLLSVQILAPRERAGSSRRDPGAPGLFAKGFAETVDERRAP